MEILTLTDSKTPNEFTGVCTKTSKFTQPHCIDNFSSHMQTLPNLDPQISTISSVNRLHTADLGYKSAYENSK